MSIDKLTTKQSVTGMTQATDPTKRLESLKKRADEIEKKKMSAEAELQFLEKQHDELLLQLKELGIEDVSDLPGTILAYEQEIEKQLHELETNISEVESKV